MKYFIDTEFIEGFHKPLFGRKRHFIDLISIGIVAENGKEYYAISNEFKYSDADDWVKKNVIDKLQVNVKGVLLPHGVYSADETVFGYGAAKIYGKPNKQIVSEIKDFVYTNSCAFGGKCMTTSNEDFKNQHPIEFYGYYSDYDWVLFCSLFGRMIDLPLAFPMYCKDLKQNIDEEFKEVFRIMSDNGRVNFNYEKEFNEWRRVGLPKQKDEHNALADAKWNYELYKFIQQL